MKFFKQLKSIKLSREEKQKSLDFLLARIEPVRNYYNFRHNNQKAPFLQLFTNHKPMIAGIIAALVLALSGGTSYAAQGALPGDTLYPVKTHINEVVQSVLATSPEARAKLDAKLAAIRLQEAEKLAQANKLTSSTAQMLTQKFDEFSQKAQERVKQLEDKGKITADQAASLNANLEAVVQAHATVLADLQAKGQMKEQLKDLVKSLRHTASSTIKARIENEWRILDNATSTSSTISQKMADNRKNTAQNKISEVEKFITNNASKVSANNVAAATAKLNEAKVSVTEGDKAYTAANYGQAAVLYIKAQRQAHEAQFYLTTSFKMERRMDDDFATSSVFASGTLKFENEKRQEVWDAREEMKNTEHKLREEVKEAREKAQELKKEFKEKMQEFRKSEPISEDISVTSTVSSD